MDAKKVTEEKNQWGLWWLWIGVRTDRRAHCHLISILNRQMEEFYVRKIKQKKVTLSQGALYGVPWRWSGWVFQKRLHLQGPVSAPGSGAGNDYRGWIVADLRPLLSHNCPTATGATREYMLFYTRESHSGPRQVFAKTSDCILNAAASRLRKAFL